MNFINTVESHLTGISWFCLTVDRNFVGTKRQNNTTELKQWTMPIRWGSDNQVSPSDSISRPTRVFSLPRFDPVLSNYHRLRKVKIFAQQKLELTVEIPEILSLDHFRRSREDVGRKKRTTDNQLTGLLEYK